MLQLPYEYSSTLMTIWLRIIFQLYMTLLVVYLSFGIPLYNTFLKHNLDHPQYSVACGNSWYDMTWYLYHGLLDDVEISSHYCYCVLSVLLRILFFPPLHGLVMRNIQWSQVSSYDRKLVSLCFLSIDQLEYSATRISFNIFPSLISFFIISPWHDKVPSSEIHSWQVNISKKNS